MQVKINNNQSKNLCEIYNNDAYKYIDVLKKNNIIVNHIITDPPYNISQKNNFATMKNADRIGLDFGKWDWNFDLLNWINLYIPLLDKNGSVIIFCSYKFISDICRQLENNSITIKDILIWKKTNPMPRNTNRRYVQDMEFAIWGVNKKAKWIFNKPKELHYLRSVFETSIVSNNERFNHPTQKSLKLMKQIITIHTNENDTILDPFMGTGTTGVAAISLNRKFIGIELEKCYFDIAKKRLSQSYLI